MKKRIFLSTVPKEGKNKGVSAKGQIDPKQGAKKTENSEVVNHDPSWDKLPAGETVAASQEEHNFLNKASDNSPHRHDDEKPLEVKKRNTVRKIFENLQGALESESTKKGTEIFLKDNSAISFFQKDLKSQVRILENFFFEKGVSFQVELPTNRTEFLVAEVQKIEKQKSKDEGKEVVGVIGNPGQHLGALEEVLRNAFALVSVMDTTESKD
jgi:Skp family chaperone for outer membrane proteins